MYIVIPSDHFNALLANLGDETRGMHAIRVEDNKLIAIDGHAMLILPTEHDGEPFTLFFNPKNKIKRGYKNGAVTVRWNEGGATATLIYQKWNDDIAFSIEVPVQSPIRDFPDWAKVVPEPSTLQTAFDQLIINPELLARTTRELDLEHPGVKLRTADKKGLGPVVANFMNLKGATLIAMPMRE